MKTGFFLGMLIVSFLVGGCASVVAFKGITLEEESVYLTGLPPIRQDKIYSCGPACFAAVAAYWNVPLSDFRERHPHLPATVTGEDLQRLAREAGLQAFVYRGTIGDLKENLRKGRPLIVMISQPLVPSGDITSGLLLNAWDKWGPKPAHWVVVIGITGNGSIIIHDPASGPILVKREAFRAWWAQNENLAVLLAAQPLAQTPESSKAEYTLQSSEISEKGASVTTATRGPQL